MCNRYLIFGKGIEASSPKFTYYMALECREKNNPFLLPPAVTGANGENNHNFDVGNKFFWHSKEMESFR